MLEYYYIKLASDDSPSVKLCGEGGGPSPEDFVKEIEATLAQKKGILWDSYTFGHYGNSSHKWQLESYQALSGHTDHDKFFLLYYTPCNPEQVIRDCLNHVPTDEEIMQVTQKINELVV